MDSAKHAAQKAQDLAKGAAEHVRDAAESAKEYTQEKMHVRAPARMPLLLPRARAVRRPGGVSEGPQGCRCGGCSRGPLARAPGARARAPA